MSMLHLEPLEPRTLFTALTAGFQDQLVVSGLNTPTAETVAPDGRIFVCEKGGTLRIVKNGSLLPSPFLSVAVDTFAERGLDGVALDPNFNANGFVYVYYTTADPSNPNVQANASHNRLSRFTVSGVHSDQAAPGSEVVLLDNIPATTGSHDGGSMQFGADGMLYLGVGDANVPANAQNLLSLNGKILRLNVRDPAHLIPTDNPFYNSRRQRQEIWAYGFRNPFTSAVKPGTSTLFINDVGSRGVNVTEEVDVLQKGGNYGWNTYEGAVNQPGFIDPLYQYKHPSAPGAITGGVFYTGTQFASKWQGKYFLADFDNQFIRAINPATGAETDFASGADSPIDLDNSPDGGLYYLSTDGTIHKITATGDAIPPTAALPPQRGLRTGGSRYYTFNITYTDNTAVDAATLDDGDILVTGPLGFSLNAKLFSVTPAGNGSPLIATYGILAPGRGWDAADNGTYTITLNRRQVRDTAGNPAASRVLGTFGVRIAAV